MYFKLFLLAALAIGLSHQQTCQKQGNSDNSSPDIGQQHYKEEWECCGVCTNTPGCVAYAWNSYEGGTCWLKGSTGPIVWSDSASTGSIGGGSGGEFPTFQEFVNAVVATGHGAPSQAQYDSYIAGLSHGLITTKQEAAMALTQFIHESDGLKAKREYRCENTGCPGDYETPGCDVAGQDYYGRGYIQLTWCFNYQPASQELFGSDILVQDPDMVARDEGTAWNTAFWFWKTNVHFQPGVQEGQFGASTRAINGVLECDSVAGQDIARLRFQMYLQVRGAFGLGGNADERGCYN